MNRLSVGPLSLELPERWTLSSVILAGPVDAQDVPGAGRPFQRNVIVTLEQVPDEETPDTYRGRQLRGLSEAGVESGVAREAVEVSLEGEDWGLLTESVIVSNEGDRVRQLQLITIKNSIAYTVIASHLDGAPFKSVEDEFRGILESFRAVAPLGRPPV